MNALYPDCACFLKAPPPLIPLHRQLADYHAAVETARIGTELRLLALAECHTERERENSLPGKTRQRLKSARISPATYLRFAEAMGRKKCTTAQIVAGIGLCRASTLRHIANLLSARFIKGEGKIRRERAYRWIG